MNNNIDLTIRPLPMMQGTTRPFVVAGPCSAESREQVLSTATQLAARGCSVFRAGVWKPRTKPGGFEGNGKAALPWLQEAKHITGMRTAIEVATAEHVELALEHGVDVLWIGARTAANPFAVQAIADALQGIKGVSVLVKNPVNPDLELWIGALERINHAGIDELAAVHRGFSSYENNLYRNAPMWQIPIELRRRVPQLPIFCDPSHIGGRRNFIAPLSQQALDLGFEGLMIEAHCCPDAAWSDAAQQLTPHELYDMLATLTVRNGSEPTEDIRLLRAQIDELDRQLLQLLAERMGVSRRIGQCKRARNMTVLQSMRYSELLESRCKQGEQCGLDAAFVGTLFEAIHEESIKQQM